MSNPQHLAMLFQGAEGWNRWRYDHPHVAPDLSGGDFTELNLTQMNFNGVNFTGAVLRGANLTAVNLGWAKLSGADLRDSLLLYTDLSHADLWRAQLGGATLCFTQFGATQLGGIEDLEDCTHFGASILDYATIVLSGGLARRFLSGCGLSADLIERLDGLAPAPARYRSCFFSFSESDAVFVERLYGDLTEAGVKCWRWREGGRWGRKLFSEIDRTTSNFDRLLAIIGPGSIDAPTVQREIGRALKLEERLQALDFRDQIVFPILLGDISLPPEHPLMQASIQSRAIRFDDWRTPDIYRAARDSLLAKLRIDGNATIPPRPVIY